MTTDRDLIAEGRQHDATMTPAPWLALRKHPHEWLADAVVSGDPFVGGDARQLVQANPHFPYRANLDGIAWMRTNLTELLDRFAAALDTIDRLRSDLDTATCARSLAEARSNAIDASHAARDQVRLRIAALLGMTGEPPPSATGARVREIMTEIRAVAETTPVTWPEIEALRILIGGSDVR